MRFIAIIEAATGRKAELQLEPMQPGDVRETFADIDDTRRDFGFDPRTSMPEGVAKFIAWYTDYYGVT